MSGVETSAQVSDVEIVPYTAARRPELEALTRSARGSTLSEAELDWWLDRNPAGPPLISLAERAGVVVAAACMSPCRLAVGGRRVTALAAQPVTVHQDYEGPGLAARLIEANESRAADVAPLLVAFPGEGSRAELWGPGWRDLGQPRAWARSARRRRLPASVEQVAGFSRRVDDLWRRLGPSREPGLVRDSAYLEWRFASSPRGYRCLASDEGVAVVGHRETDGRRVAFLADLLAPPGPASRRLLRAALAVADAPRFLALPPLGRAGDLARLGFAPTSRRIAALAKPLRPGAQIPDGWSFALGDGDSW
jgi:hypothetical protein